MDVMGIDIAQIVDLGTAVAIAGTVQAEAAATSIFDYLVGIAEVTYEQHPRQ